MKFTLALAQVDNVLADLKKNVQHHLEFIARAREGGADLVVFPELSLTGYSLKDSNWDVAIAAPGAGSQDAHPLRDIIRASSDISILLGCVEETAGFGIHNSALFFERQTVRSVHRKVYPPAYGMFEELRYFSPGDSVRAFDSILGRLGVLICEDLWHLPLPYLLAQAGAQVIIGIAASPTRLAGEGERIANARVNTEQHKAYARLLSSYVVFCNRVGIEDGVNFWGGSEVVAPNGEISVQAKLFEEDLVFATIDENEVRRARRFSRHFLDDNPRLVVSELERIVSARDR
ncbi:MAG TPA: nitrilase-related carbon-nitrogen hydrolase [Bacteroidota bacterium]|jgi:predicted amidohydrolase